MINGNNTSIPRPGRGGEVFSVIFYVKAEVYLKKRLQLKEDFCRNLIHFTRIYAILWVALKMQHFLLDALVKSYEASFIEAQRLMRKKFIVSLATVAIALANRSLKA